MKVLAVALVLVGATIGPSGGPRAVVTVPLAGSPVPVVHLPGDVRTFSTYDFRQRDLGDVDWPVAFVFRGRPSVAGIKEALCERSRHAWKYCGKGGRMFLFRGGSDRRATGGFAGDGGVKRFNERCSTTRFSAHLRLYELADAEPRAGEGAVVVGTVHLDFADRSGCTARIHGYPDVAEQWLLAAMRTVPGWTVTTDAWDLRTRSKPYVVLRKVSGVEVPHVYGQDGLANDVYVQ